MTCASSMSVDSAPEGEGRREGEGARGAECAGGAECEGEGAPVRKPSSRERCKIASRSAQPLGLGLGLGMGLGLG